MKSKSKANTDIGTAPKKQKADSTDPLVLFDSLQDELAIIDNAAADEIMKVTHKYEVKKDPLYQKRQALITQIPGFWRQVFQNNPFVGAVFQPVDLQILDHLETLRVNSSESGNFSIEMTFSRNQFFSNSAITKTVNFQDDQVAIDCTEFKWKTKTFAKDNPDSFFVCWHLDEDEIAEMTELIRTAIWRNPLAYYFEDDEDEDEDEGEDDN